MKHTAARTALAASLTLGFAAAPLALAQDAPAVDYGVAMTPANLADLLGPDGLEAAQCEFYLHMQMPGQGSGVMHWRTQVDDDRLVFTMGQTMEAGEMTNSESQVFTTDGEFVSSNSMTHSSDYKSASSAVREGDKVRVTSSYSFGGEAGENEEEVHDYAPLTDAIPTAWLPLAFAYHLREGHEQFTVRMSDDVTGEMSYIQIFHVDDIGTEMIELGDEEHEAHVLMITMDSEMDGEAFDGGVDDEETMQMYVLADGSIVRMRMEMEGMTMSAEAVTAEEAEELSAQGGEGAGEDIEDAGDAIQDAAE